MLISRDMTSDRTLMSLDQLLKCSGFSRYPLSYFLYKLHIWEVATCEIDIWDVALGKMGTYLTPV